MSNRTRMWWLRPFVQRVVNPLTRVFAGWLPGFGILTYRGRRSGRTYRTPVNLFVSGGVVTFVLTYGSDAQWVKNVLAAGECRVRTRGRDIRLVEPTLAADPGLQDWPGPRPLRLIARTGGATEYLRMRAAQDDPPRGDRPRDAAARPD